MGRGRAEGSPLNGADRIAERVLRAGTAHVFGVGGANIEDLFAAVERRRPRLRAILAKHELAAGNMADGYARASGRIGVVMATSGGAALNLVPSLAEARASSVPLVAIVGLPPTGLQGLGAFQDTSGRGGSIDAAAVFAPVARFCARVECGADLECMLDQAFAAATGPLPGPVVLLVAKDIQRSEVPSVPVAAVSAPRAAPPDRAALVRAADALGDGPALVIAGEGVVRDGGRRALARLAATLDARVAVTPEARDAFDNRSSRFVGVTGAMGHPVVAAAVAAARVVLLAGTRLPLIARQGLESALDGKVCVVLGDEAPFLEPREEWLLVAGSLRRALVGIDRCTRARRPLGSKRAAAEHVPPCSSDEPPPTALAAAILALGDHLPEDAIVLVDAGNAGAAAVHHLRMPARGRWLLATGMAAMGWTFGAAVGAALATGRRCFVIAGDGAFFMHGFEIHTAVEHDLPITYLILNNNAHGMCLVRERLLLGGEAGYNQFRPSRLGAGLAAMFPGLEARDCGTPAEVEAALRATAASGRPVVIAVDLPAVEIPPFRAFAEVVQTVELTLTLTQGPDHARRRSHLAR